MKRFFVLLCCIVMLAGSSCTESSNEETALPSGTEETSDGYTFVKEVTGYSAQAYNKGAKTLQYRRGQQQAADRRGHLPLYRS